MSIGIAVWEGEQPADDDEADRVFEELTDLYDAPDVDATPTPRLAEFAARSTNRSTSCRCGSR